MQKGWKFYSSFCCFGVGTKPNAATKQLITGLMMLKKQNGRYTIVGIPKPYSVSYHMLSKARVPMSQ